MQANCLNFLNIAIMCLLDDTWKNTPQFVVELSIIHTVKNVFELKFSKQKGTFGHKIIRSYKNECITSYTSVSKIIHETAFISSSRFTLV